MTEKNKGEEYDASREHPSQKSKDHRHGFIFYFRDCDLASKLPANNRKPANFWNIEQYNDIFGHPHQISTVEYALANKNFNAGYVNPHDSRSI